MKKILILAMLLAAPLSGQIKVLAFAGSSRDGSFNDKLAQQAAALAAEHGAIVKIVSLADFSAPIYNADLEAKVGMPANSKRFRDLMLEHDRIIIASPEYNASMTALLKNTLDWASRSENKEFSPAAFKEKTFAIMSASPGQGGGKRNLEHLRQVITALGGKVVSTTVSVPSAYQAFNGKGQLTDPALVDRLNQEIAELLAP